MTPYSVPCCSCAKKMFWLLFLDDMHLIVRKKDDNFRIVSLATNQSMDLWNEPRSYVHFILRPSEDEAFFVMRNDTGRYIIKRGPGLEEPLHFNLSLRDCQYLKSGFRTQKSKGQKETIPLVYLIHQSHSIAGEIQHIDLDFISENLYVSTTCGEIHVCNLNSLKCSGIYNLRTPSRINLTLYPEQGYVILVTMLHEWLHHIIVLPPN